MVRWLQPPPSSPLPQTPTLRELCPPPSPVPRKLQNRDQPESLTNPGPHLPPASTHLTSVLSFSVHTGRAWASPAPRRPPPTPRRGQVRPQVPGGSAWNQVVGAAFIPRRTSSRSSVHSRTDGRRELSWRVPAGPVLSETSQRRSGRPFCGNSPKIIGQNTKKWRSSPSGPAGSLVLLDVWATEQGTRGQVPQPGRSPRRREKGLFCSVESACPGRPSPVSEGEAEDTVGTGLGTGEASGRKGLRLWSWTRGLLWRGLSLRVPPTLGQAWARAGVCTPSLAP